MEKGDTLQLSNLNDVVLRDVLESDCSDSGLGGYPATETTYAKTYLGTFPQSFEPARLAATGPQTLRGVSCR